VEPIESGYWGEKPSPNEVEYHLKKRSLELQWQMRQLVNDWASTNAGISQIKYFWNANAMMAQMTPELILELAELPEVTKILFDRRVQLTYARGEPGAQADFTYGLQKLGIPQLRQEYSELTGQGVVVGILDTGIDANHPELKGKVVAWKDFIQDKDQPYDDNSHGTHVAGTIAGSGVGGTQIGVAPGVKLVIGKMLSGRGGGSLSQILRSMEWIANPDRSAAGSLRPRVVSNSWGGPMGDDLRTDPFVQAVNAWVQLEIFPSFAAGNEGPRQGSVGSPGGVPEAFAVGATDQNDQVTSFSSRGPVVVTGTDGKRLSLMKPEISAPGKDVYSTVPGGRYASYSGTSMATPHLSGVVALLYQANPSLKVADVKKILMQSAVDMGPEGKDNSYGAGRADVIRAIEVVQKGSF
jgi:subtilisin family serine protease